MAHKPVLKFLAIAGFLSASAIIHSGLGLPAYKEYKILNEKNLEIASRTDPELLASQLGVLFAEYRGSFQVQDFISSALPLNDDTASIFQYLKNAADGSNLQIESFGTGKPAQPPALGKITIETRLKGGYEGVKNLIRLIENSIRLSSVKSFQIRKSGSASIIIETYYVGGLGDLSPLDAIEKFKINPAEILNREDFRVLSQ